MCNALFDACNYSNGTEIPWSAGAQSNFFHLHSKNPHDWSHFVAKFLTHTSAGWLQLRHIENAWNVEIFHITEGLRFHFIMDIAMNPLFRSVPDSTLALWSVVGRTLVPQKASACDLLACSVTHCVSPQVLELSLSG